jgi:hypothetical protein
MIPVPRPSLSKNFRPSHVHDRCHHPTKRSKQLQRRLDSRRESRPRPHTARWTRGRRSADLTRHAGASGRLAPTAWTCVATSSLPADRPEQPTTPAHRASVLAHSSGMLRLPVGVGGSGSPRRAGNLSRLAAHKPGPTHAVPTVQAAVLSTGPKYPHAHRPLSWVFAGAFDGPSFRLGIQIDDCFPFSPFEGCSEDAFIPHGHRTWVRPCCKKKK